MPVPGVDLLRTYSEVSQRKVQVTAVMWPSMTSPWHDAYPRAHVQAKVHTMHTPGHMCKEKCTRCIPQGTCASKSAHDAYPRAHVQGKVHTMHTPRCNQPMWRARGALTISARTCRCVHITAPALAGGHKLYRLLATCTNTCTCTRARIAHTDAQRCALRLHLRQARTSCLGRSRCKAWAWTQVAAPRQACPQPSKGLWLGLRALATPRPHPPLAEPLAPGQA